VNDVLAYSIKGSSVMLKVRSVYIGGPCMAGRLYSPYCSACDMMRVTGVDE
jgi:hypothetical protein